MSKEPNSSVPEYVLKLTPEDPTALGTLKNHARLQTDPARAAEILAVAKTFQEYLKKK